MCWRKWTRDRFLSDVSSYPYLSTSAPYLYSFTYNWCYEIYIRALPPDKTLPTKKYIRRYNKSCGYYSWRWSRNVTWSKTEGQFSSARGLSTRGSRCRICRTTCGSSRTGMDLDRLFRQDGRVQPRCFCQMPWYDLINRPQHLLLQLFEHTSASVL